MQEKSMSELFGTSHLDGANAAYLEQAYEDYLRDPNSTPEKLRTYFETLPRLESNPGQDIPHSEVRDYFRTLVRKTGGSKVQLSAAELELEAKQVKVLQMINAFRFRGHQNAMTNPLGLPISDPLNELTLEFHQLNSADLDTVFKTGSFVGSDEMPLRDIYQALQQTYCGSVGVEYMHITDTAEKRWIQQRVESLRGNPGFSDEVRMRLLRQLTAAEGLEKYLHNKYVGQKRFSLEGGETLIPILHEIIHRSGGYGVKDLVIGMAHRGRLNVLVNILGKSPGELFEEFEGKRREGLASGDVKYHQGFSSDVQTEGGPVHLALAFNPSHLEIVSPVVMGSVKARQERRNDETHDQVLPITIHGDSAFTGQGVVMETFNMSQARCYKVGGTIRLVINNQVGFTTSNPTDTRSTLYCTDVAKMIEAPIFHVNADDPEACLFVTQLALDYRMQFKKDVVIDLVCYRRHGHNEADEPAATQPAMYKIIRNLPSTRAIYAERIVNQGVLDSDGIKAATERYRNLLVARDRVVSELLEGEQSKLATDWSKFIGHHWEAPHDTTVPADHLRSLAKSLEQRPDGVELQGRVAKIYQDRQKMAAGAQPVDWGFAETLAYATLLDEGHPVRISGQDCGRGTFFHRHAVLHNQKNEGESYTPLANIKPDQPSFTVIDSVLSEEAVLAFEYGFATAEPNAMVIWEAQFGDFANGAQVVVDQFISSGEQKWGRFCGLTMFLPHGYEGQGPEHSSARLERYLQLCAEHNMQVCVPSTPAQVFHMIRRQMRRIYRKPLIVMTPKSLLRHPLATSTMGDLSSGTFETVIGDVDSLTAKDVSRVVLCSGKVYYDLLKVRREQQLDNVAIVRVEQLYPFPEDKLKAILKPYKHVGEIVWCQEEPMNQGAWYSSQHHFNACLTKNQVLVYAGREASASPAVGYYSLHVEQQNGLVNDALGIK
ncbi:2-oxoglutarate dehydrogenase E1 component [Pelagibaculum spongiae]|uniref:2-oxoglutarate dehydrogenase E1 component n=1 Tax=Pelagibaculum spongiae TaxID=2080658 RepID=A0A2V1GWZ4_9GAMM|nr:2-oxoglutarate dehydrogenase E1 component [Pelagibaculum spongiae]PVZ69588.1 2-oxoglutarate dehydrogenase E1 component [Pelagibaculum spongiae]